MTRFSSTARAVVSLSETVYNHQRDALLLCYHQSTGYGYNHPKDDFLRFRLCSYRFTGYGLQSSKGWNVGACTDLLVSIYTTGASIDLSVSVYNHPRDASITALSVHVLVYWSWSTIIQGMRLFLHCWCMFRFVGLDLQSSKGCVY